MKQLIQLIIFLAFCGNLAAKRPYQPMVVEGATWVYMDFESINFCYNGQLPWNSKYIMEWFEGDTMVNGLSYKKRWSQETYTHSSQLINFYRNHSRRSLAGLWREDSSAQKVYGFSRSQNRDVLIFDFNLEIGDSISFRGQPNPYFIIDTIFTFKDLSYDWLYARNSTTRKITLEDSFTVYSSYNSALDQFPICKGEVLIEGIGLNEYLFLEHTNLVFYCRNTNECSRQIITNVPSQNPASSPLVKPNFALPGEVLQLSRLVKSMSLISLSGKEVSIASEGLTISIPIFCCSGIYALKGVDYYGNSFTQKILIQ